MKILITGSRHWQARHAPIVQKAIDACIEKYGDDIHIIHGGCDGVDALAAGYAITKELVTTCVPARWSKYDKAAGPKRNEYMLKHGKPSLVLAFHHNLKTSKGTAHMARIAEDAGVPTIIIPTPQFVETELTEELP